MTDTSTTFPRLSVLMTVYNGMPYLPAAVESVLAQDFQDYEFVIVDDGSTDETASYLKQINDPRIVYLHQENGGTAAAANFGLSHCNGVYVARMDADDVTLPTRFRKQVEFLDMNPDVGMLGTQVAPMGSARIGKSLKLPTTNHEIVDSLLAGRHALSHPTLMMRTSLLKQIGGYWRLKLVDDWDMMLRMTEVCETQNLDEVLHYYRVHRGSLNGSKMKMMRFSIDYCRDAAARRRGGRPAITHTEFEALQSSRSLIARTAESLDIYVRSQYRLATAEILGDARLRGYCRLAFAAACGPGLTIERLKRMVYRKKNRVG